MKGSATGAQATQTVESLVGQAQTALRQGRATGMRAAQAMLDSYAAMVSGVLIGMSEGLQAGTKQGPARRGRQRRDAARDAGAQGPASKRAR